MTRAPRLLVLLLAFLLPIPGAAGSADKPFAVFLVRAAHLDYGDPRELARQLHKRARLKQGFMGHSWIYLEGVEDGRRQVIDAGLSPKGEGATRFVRGVLNLSEYGYPDPTDAQKLSPRFEPNPIAYLWRDQGDGFLQPADEHKLRPTFAARVDLDEAQFRAIRARMDPALPSHRSFQLNGQQCSSFLVAVAELAGIRLEHEVTIEIPPRVTVGGKTYRLWTDPAYSRITLSSPDVLERSLRRLVRSGRASDVLHWYLNER